MKKSILLTGVLVLTLAFTACHNDKKDNTIHVESVSVASIHDLYVGDTFTVGTQTVTIEPSDASIQTYTLESDNTDVFTADGYVITAVGLGEAKLTVITDDGGLTDWTTINVIEKTDTGGSGSGGGGTGGETPDPTDPNEPDEPDEPDEPEVISITFEPDAYTLYVGDETGIDLKDHVHVEVKGEISEEYTLEISGDIEESVITLEDGWVKPKGEDTGEAEVIATAVGDETKTATATITVDKREVDEPYISSIKFDENINYSVEVGKEPLDLSTAIIPTWENVENPDTYEGEYSITFAVVSGGAEYIQIENDTYVSGLQSTTGLTSLPQVVALVTGNESVRATQEITVTYPKAISGVAFKESSYTLEYEEETSFAGEFEVNIVGTDGETPTYTWELSCADSNVTISEDKHSVTATGDVSDAVLTITITCDGFTFSDTTTISCTEPETGEVITTGKLGYLYESAYTYYYFTGSTTTSSGKTYGATSDSWSSGIEVTLTKWSAGYTLSWENGGTTYYLDGTYDSNTPFKMTTTISYVDYNSTYESIETIDNAYFLGTYSSYTTVGWAEARFYDSDYIYHIFTTEQENPEPPAVTKTLQLATSLTDGNEYYWAYKESDSLYHFFDGKTTSTYYLEVTEDMESASLVKTNAVSGGWKLTFYNSSNVECTIFCYVSGSYFDFEVSTTGSSSHSGVSTWEWDSTYNCTTITVSNSKYYAEYYNSRIQGNGYTYISKGTSGVPYLGFQFFEIVES